MTQDLRSDTDKQQARSPERDESLQDYRQRYGLSVDPFSSDPLFPFFTGGQRRELLDQIVHLCQFGHGLPIVLGERGVGKTRFANALSESFDGDCTCFISALPTMNTEFILRQIARYFGEDVSEENDAGQLLNTLEKIGQSFGEDGLALVVIDDAHDLEDEALKSILSLVDNQTSEDGGIQLVLVGELALISRLSRLNLAGIPVNELYIERFTLAETRDYLNFRMEMADYLGPEMFSESLVESWWRQAQGQIGQIHRFARQHLLEAVLPPLSKGARPFPVLHLVAIAVLGSLVFLTWLYRSDSDDSSKEVVGAQRVPINLQENEAAEASSVAEVASAALPPEVIVNEAVVPDDDPNRDSESMDLPTDKTYALPAPKAHSPVVEANTTQEASTAPVPDLARVSQVTPPASKAQPQHTTTEDEQILLSWRSTDFTLQLLGVSTEIAALDYIDKQPNREDLLLFETRRQGKKWFVVVAGRYPSAAAARAAIRQLPPDQAKAGPWPRELKVVQQEIKSL